MDASTLAARCYLEKLQMSAQYTRAAQALGNYSHGLSSRLTLYAAQDAAHGELFASLALPDNLTVYDLDDPVAPIFVPVDIDAENPDGKDALMLIRNLQAIEDGYEDFWQKIYSRKARVDVDEIISINGLYNIAHARTIEMDRMMKAIETGSLWRRTDPAPYYCSRCGGRHWDKNGQEPTEAFDKCGTCYASRNFCSLPFEFI